MLDVRVSAEDMGRLRSVIAVGECVMIGGCCRVVSEMGPGYIELRRATWCDAVRYLMARAWHRLKRAI